jgi:fumarate reductase subunit D
MKSDANTVPYRWLVFAAGTVLGACLVPVVLLFLVAAEFFRERAESKDDAQSALLSFVVALVVAFVSSLSIIGAIAYAHGRRWGRIAVALALLALLLLWLLVVKLHLVS